MPEILGGHPPESDSEEESHRGFLSRFSKKRQPDQHVLVEKQLDDLEKKRQAMAKAFLIYEKIIEAAKDESVRKRIQEAWELEVSDHEAEFKATIQNILDGGILYIAGMGGRLRLDTVSGNIVHDEFNVLSTDHLDFH